MTSRTRARWRIPFRHPHALNFIAPIPLKAHLLQMCKLAEHGFMKCHCVNGIFFGPTVTFWSGCLT